MKLSTYKILDISILSIVAIFLEFINVKALMELHTVFQVSVSLVVMLMMMIRWQKSSVLPIALVIIIRSFLIYGGLDLNFILTEASIIVLLPLLIKWGKTHDQLHIIHLLGFMGLLLVTQSSIAGIITIIKENSFITGSFLHLSRSLLSFVVSSVIVILANRQNTLLIYMPKFLVQKKVEF